MKRLATQAMLLVCVPWLNSCGVSANAHTWFQGEVKKPTHLFQRFPVGNWGPEPGSHPDSTSVTSLPQVQPTTSTTASGLASSDVNGLSIVETLQKSVTLFWLTTANAQSTITYQAQGSGGGPIHVDDPYPGRQHLLHVSNLLPATSYDVVIDGATLSVSTLPDNSIFSLPPRQTKANLSGISLTEVTPYLTQVNGSANQPSSAVSAFAIKNNGSQPLQDPFLFTPEAINLMDLDAAIGQIEQLSPKPEDRMVYAWDLIASNVPHYCAAGDVNYLSWSPIELLNFFGFGCCDNKAVALAALGSLLGIPTRHVTIDGGGGHSIMEAFYDNAWHMFDADWGVFFRNTDGSIANVQQLKDNPNLVTSPGWQSNIEATSNIGYYDISREQVLQDNGDVPALSTPPARTLNQTSLNWRLYPHEMISFAAVESAMTPAKFMPYPDYGPPPNIATGHLTFVAALDGSDDRIQFEGNTLAIYSGVPYPMRGGTLIIHMNSSPSFNATLAVMKGQDIRAEILDTQITCEPSTSGGCDLTIDVAAAVESEKENLSTIYAGKPPFQALPRLYFEITYPFAIDPTLVGSITGDLQVQASLSMFPRQDVVSTYVYQDRNPAAPKSVVVSIAGRSDLIIESPAP